MKQSFRARFRRGLRWLGLAVLTWLATTIAMAFALRWINPPVTSFMVRDRVAAWFDRDRSYHFDHQWVDYKHIAIPMKVAVMASEDQKFPQHHGFDFESMEHAWDQNKRGHKIRGGSTITQQTAKNLFLWPGRNLLRKGIEAWFTVLLETFCSKQRILELYLNSVEFGKGVFGVEAASKRYFHKSAAQLTTAESALLAAVLPAPKRFSVTRPSGYLRARQAWIMAQMPDVDTGTLLMH